jgi:hypothetical protein
MVVSFVGLLGLGLAAPASAATEAPTPATLTITAGVLEISAPTEIAHLGTRANTLGGGTVIGQLGIVKVTDARTTDLGWTATAISSAFTLSPQEPIPAANVSYSAGAITEVGDPTCTANDQSSLAGVSPVVTATAAGDNSAEWNPTLTVAVPGGTVGGLYSAVVTHSVL